eukprot:2381364-Amphidinium_carterae.2
MLNSPHEGLHDVVLSTTPHGNWHSTPHFVRDLPAKDSGSAYVSPQVAAEWNHLKSLLDPLPCDAQGGDSETLAEEYVRQLAE